MGRVIKFRVFDGVRFFTPIIDEDGKVYDGHRNYEDGIDSYPNIMQFTGLFDKNGVEIYEGDLVEFAGWKPKEIVWEGETGFAGFRLKGTDAFLMGHDSKRMIVVGNKYYNPELLNA